MTVILTFGCTCHKQSRRGCFSVNIALLIFSVKMKNKTEENGSQMLILAYITKYNVGYFLYRQTN